MGKKTGAAARRKWRLRRLRRKRRLARRIARLQRRYKTKRGLSRAQKKAIKQRLARLISRVVSRKFKRWERRGGGGAPPGQKKPPRPARGSRRSGVPCSRRHVPTKHGRFKVRAITGAKIALAGAQGGKYCGFAAGKVDCTFSGITRQLQLRSTCVRGCKRGALPVAVGSVITLKTRGGRYVSGKAGGAFPRRPGFWERFLVVDAGSGFVALKAGAKRCRDEGSKLGEGVDEGRGLSGAGWLLS